MTSGPNEPYAPAPTKLDELFVDRESAPALGTYTGPFATNEDYGIPPGYPGPNTTGADLTVLSSRDPNSLEYLRILHAQENLRWTAYHESKLRAREAARIGPYITDIGRVILAQDKNENCNYLFWRSHATTIEELGGTPFSPNRYSAFDRQFELNANFPALTNPGMDYPGAGPGSYSYWKPLRTNLAIVRNLIYSQYFPDGEFNPSDKEDQKKRQMIEEMANELGGVFARSTLPLVGETFSGLPVSLANIPDQGAQRIYKYLAANSKWGLTNVQDTALSDAQLAAFTEATSDVSGINETLGDYLAKRAEQTKDMAIAAAQPHITPEQMSADAQAQSIREAKTILDKFRLQYAIASLDLNGKEMPQARVAYGEPQEDIVMADQLTMLARLYEQNIRHLAAIPGGVDPSMQALHKQTTTTLGKLAFALRDRAEWAVYHTWDDPQGQLKAQHLTHTFPQDGAGIPLPAEWRQAEPGVKQPLLAYATNLYSSIQAVQARIRILQQDKGQDERFTGIVAPGMENGADIQPGQGQTLTSVLAGLVPSASPKNDVAGSQQKLTQQVNFQQNHSAGTSTRNERAAVRLTQGSEAAPTSAKSTAPRTPSSTPLPASIKSSAALQSSINALKNFGLPQNVQAAQVNTQTQTQRQRTIKTTDRAAAPANSKAIGAFTANATRPSGSGASQTPPQPTAENVLPGSKNKQQWVQPGPTKGPGF